MTLASRKISVLSALKYPWQAQDATWAGEEKVSYFTELARGIRRWSEFDRSKAITLGLDLLFGRVE